MKKTFLVVLFLLVFGAFFVGCKDSNDPEKEKEKEQEPAKELVYAEGTELSMAVAHNSTKTSISYLDGSVVEGGLTLANGKTYQQGDLKPVWEELEKILKVTFKDNYSGGSSAQNEYKHWQELNFEGVDIVVGNASDMAEDGKNGKIVDLSQWLDYMPNLKKFLEENPIVYLSLLSDLETGSFYYAPYFDGYDDIEKYYLMRADWLELLLDGEGEFTAQVSDKFGDICGTLTYTPYMPTTGKVEIDALSADGKTVEKVTKDYSKNGNIIDTMSKQVTAETTGVQLVNMFRDYIDTMYDGKYGTKRSNLFLGYNACWDADELVALLRCVVTNTYALTGQNETKVTGIFPREAALNRTSDLFSLVSMFGVRGYESRNDYLYFNSKGELCDARGQEDYAVAIDKLNQLYKEGLIMQGFDTTTDTINKVMFQQNRGFMLYDYVQTQTIYNADKTTLAAAPNFKLTPAMNPVAKWYDGTDGGVYMRFTESWRSVKTSGWCIPVTCTGDKLQAALKVFDYMYSDEGAVLMSYGPEAWRSGKTITYKGNPIPELSEAALDELWTLQSGNYTNYARIILGSTLPIGFVKDQGMEYQCTTDGGKEGAAIVSAALAAGTIKHVSPEIGDNLFYTMVPTTLPTTSEQDAALKEFGAIGSSGIYSKASKKYNIFIEVIKNGFGSGVELTNNFVTVMPESGKALVDNYYNNLGGRQYIEANTIAWAELLAFYNENIK